MDSTRAVTGQPGTHGEQLAKRDLALPRIIHGKGFRGQVARIVNLLIQPVGEEIGPFVHQDAHGNTGERLAAGHGIRSCLTVGPAEVSFVHKPTMPHNQETSILARSLDVLEGLIEFLNVQTGFLPDFIRHREGTPSPCAVGWWKVLGKRSSRADRHGHKKLQDGISNLNTFHNPPAMMEIPCGS